MISKMAALASIVSSCLYKYESPSSRCLLNAFLLFLNITSLFTTSQAFSQGSMIAANFEQTYCQSGLGALDRGPVHYDLNNCRGRCTDGPAPRGAYAIVADTSEYSVDTVQVELRANGNRGANIRGFAIAAIAEDRRTVGRWVVDDMDENPDVFRGTCDSLLEGQVIFHARPSNDRRRVVVTWSPRNTNFGRIRFRAWVVQQHNVIFTVDSQTLTNPLDGREFMSIESHFADLVSIMRPENQQSLTSARQSRERTSTSGSTSSSSSSRGNQRSRIPTRVPVTASSNRNLPTNSRNRQSNNREEAENIRRASPSSSPARPSISIAEFEDAFLVRLTSGFDLSDGDPFDGFNEEIYGLRDFIPDPSMRDDDFDDDLLDGPIPGGSRRPIVISGANSRQFPQGVTGPSGLMPWQIQSQLPGFQNQLLGQNRFAGQLSGRNQFIGRNQFMGQFPGQNQFMGQFPGQNQFMGQFPGQNQFMGQFPGQNQFMGQFPRQNQVMGQFPRQNQFMGQIPSPNQFMGQFPAQNQFMGQFPGQFPGQSNIANGFNPFNSDRFGSPWAPNNVGANRMNGFAGQPQFVNNSPWPAFGNTATNGNQNGMVFPNGGFNPNMQQFQSVNGANQGNMNFPNQNRFSQFPNQMGAFGGAGFNNLGANQNMRNPGFGQNNAGSFANPLQMNAGSFANPLQMNLNAGTFGNSQLGPGPRSSSGPAGP